MSGSRRHWIDGPWRVLVCLIEYAAVIILATLARPGVFWSVVAIACVWTFLRFMLEWRAQVALWRIAYLESVLATPEGGVGVPAHLIVARRSRR